MAKAEGAREDLRKAAEDGPSRNEKPTSSWRIPGMMPDICRHTPGEPPAGSRHHTSPDSADTPPPLSLTTNRRRWSRMSCSTSSERSIPIIAA